MKLRDNSLITQHSAQYVEIMSRRLLHMNIIISLFQSFSEDPKMSYLGG